jgi:hypothetical protein
MVKEGEGIMDDFGEEAGDDDVEKNKEIQEEKDIEKAKPT